jgi:ABC-2 type transport system permease protein
MYTTFRKEVLELSRDGRGWLLFAVFGTLLVLSVWINHARVQEMHLANTAAATAEYDRWLAQGKRGAHSAAHYGMWAFKPAGPLSVADPGIESFVGNAVWLEAHYQNAPLHRPAQDATLIERFGALSPAVVLGVVGPLVLILLGFGTVARERENGTWTLALSQGARAAPLLRAKAVALLSWFALASLPGLAFLVWSLFASDLTLDGAEATWRLLVWLGGFAAYLVIVVTTVVAVSSLARSALAALGVLLAAWVLMAVWLPRLTPMIGSQIIPLPTQQQFSAVMAQSLGDAEGGDAEEALKARLLKEYGVERIEDLPINWVGISLQESEERGDVVFDRFWGELFDTIERQQSFQSWMGFLSPSLAVKGLSERVAGSDFAHHRVFLSQTESHRRLIQQALNDELVKHPIRDGAPHLSDRSLWERVPPFRYVGPVPSEVLRTSVASVLALVGWLIAVGMLLAVAGRASAEART